MSRLGQDDPSPSRFCDQTGGEKKMKAAHFEANLYESFCFIRHELLLFSVLRLTLNLLSALPLPPQDQSQREAGVPG